MASALLELAVHAKDFQQQRVISALGFALYPGEITCLVGPSGCGKSTVLRIIAGLDKDYQGRVLIDGQMPDVQSRAVGFIFQEPRLLPWLTVAENVGFEGGNSPASGARVRELLGEVGLSDHADAYPKHLSGGMAQRVAIARGLFRQPQLLLLDEPFSAVDAFTRMRLQDLLLAMAARHATTLLMVTHDVGEAAYLSDRVIVMDGRPGRIAGEVPLDMARPRDRRNPWLARKEADILALLNDGHGSYGHAALHPETARASQPASSSDWSFAV